MPLVNENQVVAFKGFYRHADAAAPFFLYQPGDFGDLNRAGAAEHSPGGVRVKAGRRNVGRLHFLNMLPAQPIIGSYQQNVVRRWQALFLVIVQKLAVVEMQQQRLAAARGHPEGQLLQVRFIELRVAFIGPAVDIVLAHEIVQVAQQDGRAATVAVQIDFGVQRRQILEIAQSNRPGPAGVHCHQVRPDVGVIFRQALRSQVAEPAGTAG